MEKHILLLILLILVQVSISVTSSNETDQEALLAFQNLITSPSHFLANNWTKNTSFCSWFGVTCSSKSQKVGSLVLPNLQLQGEISPSLSNLSFLRELNLGNNLLHGHIPNGLGHLPRLLVIDIQNNQLQGSIPTSLFQHQRVRFIRLAFNKLGGELWKGPCLSGNRINGDIPKEIGNLNQLAKEDLPNLKELLLEHNQLVGEIPPYITNASKLEILGLEVNFFSGTIPTNLGNLRELRELFLFGNQLTNEPREHELRFLNSLVDCIIPKSLETLIYLKDINVSFNDLEGGIPRGGVFANSTPQSF
ncbi:LRR receptor-like serine/threonine-protein kinase EFR [Lycium ferocissimum]|uniref:LRR receptor-like serine/threonine-protein kinase EFR n=1 Tax=Lycium ferocissimum TaxID=112874 RepID=UPI002815BA88|nr:LRR receptor-like serine/threonine-protein kinase EFR [Lycium ferocissimum]